MLDTEYDAEEGFAKSQLSNDGRRVAFVKHVAEKSELWLASTDDGRTRRLLSERPDDDEPKRNLTGFCCAQFSPDDRTIFFLADAWVTSAAVHAIDVRSGAEKFVVDAVGALVVRAGPHAGRLFVERHRYKTFPGEGFHSYEWCGIVDRQGRIVKTLSEDETLCPSYAPEDREKIHAELRIPAGGRGLP